MSDLPEPLVAADVDIRGMSSFMLDVDRLLASELVALGTPEECWHAIMLWCRAWQQNPPGSLPNDERVLAAFSRAGTRWKKVREMALRGFILCSDGRLYHPVIAKEAISAWTKRKAYKADQDRLQKWRNERRNKERETAPTTQTEMGDEIHDETLLKPVSGTVSETPSETATDRVREPDRQGQGQGQRKSPPTSVGGSHARTRGGGSVLLADWMPDPAGVALAAELGLDFPAVLAKFRDFHRGHGRRSPDWDAVWRNWCRDDKTKQKQSSGTTWQHRDAADRDREILQRAGVLDAAGNPPLVRLPP